MARVDDHPWWEMDMWAPRCDPRIPLRDREPDRSRIGDFTLIAIPWLRKAAQWSLGAQLESGMLTWSTVQHDRLVNLTRFGRWLETLDNPTEVVTSLSQAPHYAESFRQYASNPNNRMQNGKPSARVSARSVNDDIRVAAELLAYMAANRDEAHQAIGPSPWDGIDDAHPAVWLRKVARIPKNRMLDDSKYVDSHALAQITAHLPALGAPVGETVAITLNSITKLMPGYGDEQAMRMLTLQIMTGRRANEICMLDYDCLSTAPPGAMKVSAGERIARFHYAQSKIEGAEETIFVDEPVIGLIEEQRNWLKERFPNRSPRYLFQATMANRQANKHYPMATYQNVLREFSEEAAITDSTGNPLVLSHTHRFRHTRITDLAEQGVPVHVLQRYAGHRSAVMTMHYVAKREEHEEQAFLAARKFTATGQQVVLSSMDHDAMHLFDRADRFLPNGYCLLPPLQTCEKGNACLTCSVFVTDDSHLDTLTRHLEETKALIARTTEKFQERHGRQMPEDNVWLAQTDCRAGCSYVFLKR